jgi:alpha-amylase
MTSRRAGAIAVAAVTAAALVTSAGATPRPRDEGADIVQHSLRPPVTDENFYFVMADRFANGDEGNDTGGLGDDPLVSGFDPTRANHYQGGDIAGLLEQIDYIEGLGTTAIWLTPSFRNKPVQVEGGNPSAGYHGYWVTDFTSIDPHLGTNEELRALVDAAHERGMKVFFDIITNHTADVVGYEEGARTGYVSKDDEPYRDAAGEPFDDRDYAGTDTFPDLDPATSFPYTPVLEAGEEDLKVPDWLNDVTLYHNRGDTTFAGEDALYGDFFGLDDIFTEHPRVVEGMIDIYRTWVADVGIDGYRIDTMKHVNDEFWQAFGPAVLTYAREEQDKDEFFMFGEVFDGSRSFTSRFTTTNQIQAVLDFPFQGAARTYASQGGDAQVLRELFEGDDWYTDADSNVYQLPTFLGNHDVGRIGAFLLEDADETGGADDAELLARSRLAHELMYLSRGNPVVYYGDEQGFTGILGFEGSRQSLFPSRVPDYLDDDLIGTEATHAVENFDPEHPLYRAISDLASLTEEHPALRNGAHQHRYAAEGAGIYAFSRVDHEQQREYLVVLNNSEEPRTANIPIFAEKRPYRLIYGEGVERAKASRSGDVSVTVEPFSALVYVSSGRIPRSPEAPAIELGDPEPAEGARGRMEVAAEVDGDSFYEVTFQARVGGGDWTTIGTDDTAPYRVFHDTSRLAPGTALAYRAAVLDNAGHTNLSATKSTSVPEPVLQIVTPAEGATAAGSLLVQAVADPERATHVVRFERSVSGGAWTEIGTDDSSPTYSVRDDLSTLDEGTQVRYRALLTDGSTAVTSDIRTVTVGNPPQPDAVAAAGSFNSEIGCPEDWQPQCDQAQLAFDTEDQVWRLTVTLPAETYEYKAALNRSWDVNYGAGGVPNGGNVGLTLTAESQVTFTYDHATNVISHTVAPVNG